MTNISRHQLQVLHSDTTTQITAADGFQVTLCAIGASVQRVRVPVGGDLRDVVLSFADTHLYEDNPLYAGATLAPTAGRISHGRLPIHHPGGDAQDGSGTAETVYQLSLNEAGHNLHGGFHNASFQRWALCDLPEGSRPHDGSVQIRYTVCLPDGLDGFPGNRRLTTTYTIGPGHTILTAYEAETDRDTYLNMSGHSYFNLDPAGSGDALDHSLQIDASHVILTDEQFIPARIAPVGDTAFDFRKSRQIRTLCETYRDDPQLTAGRGYNHAFITDKKQDRDSSPILTLTSSQGDLRLQMFSDAPCVVVYSGGFIDDSYLLADGRCSQASCGLALEMQDYPDAPGGHGFPYVITRAGEVFSRFIKWQFIEHPADGQ